MENGGQAFARPTGEATINDKGGFYNSAQKGMSLWDYYAGQTLNGIVSHPKHFEDISKEYDPLKIGDHFSILAFDMADAMIKERQKRMAKNDRS